MSEAPGAMALNEATHRLYVAEMSGIQVVDTLTGATVARISLPPTSIGVLPVSPAVDLAVNARTNTLYATDLFRGQLVVIDGATNSVVDRVPVGRSPWGVAVNATTNRIYVANSKSDTVSVIDGSSRKVMATVAVPGAFLVATTETGNRIYLSTSNGLAVLDGSTNRVLETLAYGSLVPFAVSDFPRRVYGNDGSGVRVFDIDSGRRSGSLSGRYVTGLAVDTRADRLYVAEELGERGERGVLRVFSGDGSRDLGSVPLDASPQSVIAEPNSGLVYIGMSTEGCSPLSPGICQSSVLVVGAGDSVSAATPAPIATPTQRPAITNPPPFAPKASQINQGFAVGCGPSSEGFPSDGKLEPLGQDLFVSFDGGKVFSGGGTLFFRFVTQRPSSNGSVTVSPPVTVSVAGVATDVTEMLGGAPSAGWSVRGPVSIAPCRTMVIGLMVKNLRSGALNASLSVRLADGTLTSKGWSTTIACGSPDPVGEAYCSIR